MSIRENIQIFAQININQYLGVLKNNYGASHHPNEPGALLVDELPFFVPQQIENHISILGFNMAPLSPLLIQVLVDHSELAPEDTLIRWLQEQTLVMERRLGDIRDLEI